MLTFSPIKESDAKELSVLDAKCFAVPWSETSFSNEANNPIANYVIARIDDKIVGYAGFWAVTDEGQITNIAVLKEFRRQKIAHKMLTKLIEKAKEKNLCSLSLEVRASNIAAINLYSGFGFKPVGIRKNYYKNPTENAIFMDLIFERN